MAKVLKKEIKNNYTWYKYTVIWHTVYLTGPVYEEKFAKETKKKYLAGSGLSALNSVLTNQQLEIFPSKGVSPLLNS